MIVPRQIRDRYQSSELAVTEAARRVRETVLAFAEPRGYPFAGRVKSLESVAEKIETGRYGSWDDIDDLYGCVVVVPTLIEEPEVVRFLRDTFEVVDVKARGTTLKSPEVFRFEATRVIAKLKPPTTELAPQPLFQVLFEVQIRTAFEHAWSAATHSLVYKTASVSWQRMRLAAQLKAAVEQLDTLVLAFEESAGAVVAHSWPQLEMQIRVAEYFASASTGGRIPPELGPKDLSRFSQNVCSMLRAGGRREQKIEELVELAIEAVDKELGRIGSQNVSRAISLFQLVLGVCVRDRVVSSSLLRFVPVITPELTGLYPETASLAPIFQIEPVTPITSSSDQPAPTCAPASG